MSQHCILSDCGSRKKTEHTLAHRLVLATPRSSAEMTPCEFAVCAVQVVMAATAYMVLYAFAVGGGLMAGGRRPRQP